MKKTTKRTTVPIPFHHGAFGLEDGVVSSSIFESYGCQAGSFAGVEECCGRRSQRYRREVEGSEREGNGGDDCSCRASQSSVGQSQQLRACHGSTATAYFGARAAASGHGVPAGFV
uniref:Uncharacterized protein n=1 Tax=Caenorhabditis japonica TaxID=281687 RepID=A0A8R1I6J2_CAEJA